MSDKYNTMFYLCVAGEPGSEDSGTGRSPGSGQKNGTAGQTNIS